MEMAAPATPQGTAPHSQPPATESGNARRAVGAAQTTRVGERILTAGSDADPNLHRSARGLES